jgi:hypothetical protein
VLAGLLGSAPADPATCSSLSWHALLALCWPFIIRFVQCIRVYAATGNSAQVSCTPLHDGTHCWQRGTRSGCAVVCW